MTSEPDDASLAVAAAAGDERAFTQLMRLHKASLYRFVRRYVGDAEEAYDLLQETFAAAWRALKTYDPARPVAVWLRAIALNKCRDWSRRRTVRRWLGRAEPIEQTVLRDPSPDPEAALAETEEARHLDRAIAALPAGLKEPLLLTAIEGLSQEQVGALLGLSAKAVEVRVYRARRKLLEQFPALA